MQVATAAAVVPEFFGVTSMIVIGLLELSWSSGINGEQEVAFKSVESVVVGRLSRAVESFGCE